MEDTQTLHEHMRRGGVTLYEPSQESDSCGIGFVAQMHNKASHKIVRQGLELLCNLTHRGAVGANPDEGDGVGMLTHIPHRLLHDELGDALPPRGHYGVAMIFMPRDDALQKRFKQLVASLAQEHHLTIAAWRAPPLNRDVLGSLESPCIEQCIVASQKSGDELEKDLYRLRKDCEKAVGQWKDGGSHIHISSCSSRTIVYKGMMVADVFAPFYEDLTNESYETAVALVHQRFSTNTFPSWSLAQPFRLLCHNGEINTLSGNRHWLRAREFNICDDSLSDSACLDETLDLLLKNGYDLPHGMKMLIPDVWEQMEDDDERRYFAAYHALKMEAWDGPASVAFCDGGLVGAVLDRNGLRPVRYHVTQDGVVVLSSEMGGVALASSSIVRKGRLKPGEMMLVDLQKNTIVTHEDIMRDLRQRQAWRQWYESCTRPLKPTKVTHNDEPLDDAIKSAFGYTWEDESFYLIPMMTTGGEPTGSMGADTPPAVLSHRARLLFDYFKQRFAQVTNPAIDPIRESLVMSLKSFLGKRLDVWCGEPLDTTIMTLESPFLTEELWASLQKDEGTVIVNSCYEGDLAAAVSSLQQQAYEAASHGARTIVVSDRTVSSRAIAMPSLLALAAVHHHLVRHGLRCRVSLVVDSGECREPHHMALLAGYGADAIHPWLALRVVRQLARHDGRLEKELSAQEAVRNYVQALEKSLLKIMSKMGIATYRSYCGAQIFDCVGLHESVVREFFTGTVSHLSGMDLQGIADENKRRHEAAFAAKEWDDVGGDYAFRIKGEAHVWTPDTIASLQHGVRGESDERYRQFADAINEQQRQLLTLRGALEFTSKREKIALSDVESETSLMRRFATGAMSFGSISREAHSTLAVAMNRLGGKSNTGEGGEEAERFEPMDNGDSMRSAIKQVASGRFGVTAHYLVNGDDIQIKICQGAKPGEGGQLPGHKVDEVIARVRHSVKGVGLISPPPHHDIYSIEDLAQLIFDLKNVNERARISVKLASEVGVGVVAAGVAKARADHITIAGYEGGTGASPLTSIKHAGLPWELGLAETHQTLVLNRLRDRVVVQVDGGFRTGRDVAIGALLGADEFGFSTAPLIALGCLMMRKCHLNSCPVGIATQDPVLRQRFMGKPDHVVRYFYYVTQELRAIMAQLGYRRLDDMIGHSDNLTMRGDWQKRDAKVQGLNFDRLLCHVPPHEGDALHAVRAQQHPIDDVLDRTIIKDADTALNGKEAVSLSYDIGNANRSTGAMLSGEVARRHGAQGLKEDAIHVAFQGTAGQSFGAFLHQGIAFHLRGEANDYVGKGLCGGRIVIAPPEDAHHIIKESHAHSIIGNTVLYGATGGELYAAGQAGERFAVRNSGAIAVVEGAGDHCCEYMTGGIVVVLGAVGVNMAAGMSGGIAYVFDEEGVLPHHCNRQLVTLAPVSSEPYDTNHQSLTRDDWLHNPLERDAWRLYHLVMRHYHYTASSRARAILDDWHHFIGMAQKITPIDYERALTSDTMMHNSEVRHHG